MMILAKHNILLCKINIYIVFIILNLNITFNSHIYISLLQIRFSNFKACKKERTRKSIKPSNCTPWQKNVFGWIITGKYHHPL